MEEKRCYESMLDVICIGSATVDHFLTIEQPFRQLHLGDKMLVTAKESHSGGGATNVAAGLAKLGLKVKMLTKLGQDMEAKFIVHEMQQYGVSNLCRHHSTKNTDVATIISSTKEKDRLILVHKNASLDLHAADFHKRELNAHWIYLSSLLGKSMSVGKEIAKYAYAQKIPLLFNPSMYLAKKGQTFLKPILDGTEMLILNLEEAQALAESSSSGVESLLYRLRQTGPKTVIITNGAKRVAALQGETIYFLTPPKVKVVHTAGAGDAFAAGVLAGILKNHPFEQSLRLGQVNALSVIQHVGTKNKLLSEREANQLIQKFRIEVQHHAR